MEYQRSETYLRMQRGSIRLFIDWIKALKSISSKKAPLCRHYIIWPKVLVASHPEIDSREARIYFYKLSEGFFALGFFENYEGELSETFRRKKEIIT